MSNAGSVSIGKLARELGLSPSRVRQLADAGRIPSLRTPGGHRRFDLAAVREAMVRCAAPPARDVALDLGVPEFERAYPLARLEEHLVWRDVREELRLDPSTKAGGTMQYAFHEMMNNAIDHSQGSRAVVRFWKRPDVLAFEVTDDGVGAFERLRVGLALPDNLASIQQLTKGKQTTDPDRHTGEGVFFTSKAVDLFRLSANGWSWLVDNLREDQSVAESEMKLGTAVFCSVDPATERDHTRLFREYEIDGAFAKTKTVVKLFEIGTAFVSRSEARRLLSGLDAFRVVELDFRGVEAVGQGFVDEVFRVWPSMHPDVDILPTNMAPAVEFMVRRGLGGRGT